MNHSITLKLIMWSKIFNLYASRVAFGCCRMLFRSWKSLWKIVDWCCIFLCSCKTVEFIHTQELCACCWPHKFENTANTCIQNVFYCVPCKCGSYAKSWNGQVFRLITRLFLKAVAQLVRMDTLNHLKKKSFRSVVAHVILPSEIRFLWISRHVSK